MKKRKYESYSVATEYIEEVFFSYKEAFCSYHRSDDSATLYGIDEFGNVSVILSK